MGHEVVLLDPRDGRMYTLNAVASAVWRMLPAPDVSTLVDRVVEHFNVDAVQATADVSDLLEDLVTKDLVSKSR